MRIVVVLLLLSICCYAGSVPHAAATAVTLALSGNGSVLPVAGAYTFSFSGSGTATQFGDLTFSGGGQFSSITNLNATTPVTGTMVLTFLKNGDTLNASFSIPAGVLIATGSTTATGSITITGGTGQFAGAGGSFPGVTGSGKATSLSTASFQLQGDGTVTTPGPSGPPPPVISANGVVTATSYGGSSDVAPGTWIEIYGMNLSATTRPWGGTDFTNSGKTAPTSLDGVKVTVGGQAAFVSYVSPAQVNALVASNAAVGPSQLTLTNSVGTTVAYNLTIKPLLPGLLAPASLLINGKQYVGALVANTQTLEGIPANAAKPGDVVTMYGIGFGAVTPVVDAGTVASDLTSLPVKPQFLFGSTPAQLTYYGLAPGFTGLYQFNLVIPALTADPGVPLTINVGGVAGTQTLYIAVQQ